MTDDLDMSDVIAHATLLGQRGIFHTFAGPLARLAELSRVHLETLDSHRNGDATEIEVWRAEHRLRTALYGPAATPPVLAPPRDPGWLMSIWRAFRWTGRRWRP